MGENCLSDGILTRYGIKSFSSPYSAIRSNIEHILYFENNQFRDFLNLNNLRYELDEGEKVIKNSTGIQLKNKYHYTCMNEVEFKHHDIINDNNARKTMKRRFLRLLNLKNKKIYMLYYHRLCEDTDENQLLDSLNELKDIYSSRNNSVYIYCFEQVIVLDPKERRVESYFKNGIYKYVFYTLNEWAGKNKDIFFAKCDDDLIKVMVDSIKANARRNKNAS